MGEKNNSRSSRGVSERVKTAKRRKTSSVRWLARQLNDPYVQRARREGYRSRAAFKLLELDEKFQLLRKDMKVIDLGAAPGGWTQVAVRHCGEGCVVGIDLLPVDPVPGAVMLEMDFMDDEAPAALRAHMGQAHIVLSDMAPNASGNPSLDHLRIMGLAEAAFHFAREVLMPGGAFVAKVWQGGAQSELLAEIKKHFASVKHAKPESSRKDSAETFLVAQGFRP